ncbi:MAG: response regulator transcription factor [Bacteroidales bacterium]|nr:response regulator transcription factor [Bacteroidales bacterium]
MIKTLLIEDSAVFAMGLRLALQGDKNISIVDHVSTAGTAISYLNAHPDTDVAIVDISLEQQTDGITLLSILREAFPHISAIVLSHYKTPSYIIQSISYGAKGYLAKDSKPAEIARAVEIAAAGDCIFFGDTIPEKEIIRLFGGEDKLKARRPQSLTPKEMEVLQMVTSGYSNSQIASAMGVATTTVDSYKERIKGKLGFDTIVECVAFAVSSSLVNVR